MAKVGRPRKYRKRKPGASLSGMDIKEKRPRGRPRIHPIGYKYPHRSKKERALRRQEKIEEIRNIKDRKEREVLEHIWRVVEYVYEYAKDSETTSWLTIKKEIVFMCSSSCRSRFSRRHKTTRKHEPLNELETKIVEWWYSKTGIILEIPMNMRHNPDGSWVYKPRGWALVEHNNKRRKEKEDLLMLVGAQNVCY